MYSDQTAKVTPNGGLVGFYQTHRKGILRKNGLKFRLMIYPYGSKYLLRRYFTPQIVP